MRKHIGKMVLKSQSYEIIALKGKHHKVWFNFNSGTSRVSANDDCYIKPIYDDGDESEVVGFSVEYNKDWRWG